MPPKKGNPSRKEINEARAEAELLAGMSKKDRIRYEAQKRNAMLANRKPHINENGSYNLNEMYNYLVLLRSVPGKTRKIENEIRQLETNMANYLAEKERPRINHRVRKEQERLALLRQQQEEREAYERQIREAALREQEEHQRRIRERNERIQREIDEREAALREQYRLRKEEERRRREEEQNFNVPQANVSQLTIPNELRNNEVFLTNIQELLNYNPENETIKKLYKQLMLKYHPNKRRNNTKAGPKTAFISEVYQAKIINRN
jgi:hypothetical protein